MRFGMSPDLSVESSKVGADDSEHTLALSDRGLSRWMNGLLLAGVLLRLAVLLTAAPNNPDPHQEVIEYIVEHHALPTSNVLNQSYHPPLYYLLNAPLWAIWHSSVPLHILSFVFSTLNLLLIRRLLDHPTIAPQGHTKLIAMGFACFMPEFVMFSGFVSNDTLTFLVGTLLFWRLLKYIERQSAANLTGVALCMGLGLLTKATFLSTWPVLVVLVCWLESRAGQPRRTVAAVAMFCLISLAVGCYKYVENATRLGHVFVHNLDAHNITWEKQRGTWKGPQTLYDLDIIKLIRDPILHPSHTFSIPTLLYATLWYPHIPNSSYIGNWHGYEWVGSMIYAAAIVPTLLFVIGLGQGVSLLFRQMRSPRTIALASGSMMLLANLALVVAVGLKYDVWSCFQSRLCFQSMLPGLALFGLGADGLRRFRIAGIVASAICWIAIACFLLYFCVEIALVYQLLPLGPELQP
jgi:hypothetical protein